jgi:hypothetical protein
MLQTTVYSIYFKVLLLHRINYLILYGTSVVPNSQIHTNIIEMESMEV